MRFKGALVRLQTRYRGKLARRQLTQLKIDARSVKKISEERDELLERLKEMERKFAEMQAGQSHALSPSPASPVSKSEPSTPSTSMVVSKPTFSTPTPSHSIQPFHNGTVTYSPVMMDEDGQVITLEQFHKLQDELLQAKVMLSTALSKSHHGGNGMENGWSKTISTNYSLLGNHRSVTIRKSVSQEISIPLDATAREIKMNEQLQMTAKELSKYKLRVRQLEEQNRKLTLQPIALLEKEGKLSGGGSAAKKYPLAIRNENDGHDSDDSVEDDGKSPDMIQELENRNSNWQAYLDTFDETNSIRGYSVDGEDMESKDGGNSLRSSELIEDSSVAGTEDDSSVVQATKSADGEDFGYEDFPSYEYDDLQTATSGSDRKGSITLPLASKSIDIEDKRVETYDQINADQQQQVNLREAVQDLSPLRGQLKTPTVEFQPRLIADSDADSDNEVSDSDDVAEDISTSTPLADIWQGQNPDDIIFELISMSTVDFELVEQLLSLHPRVVKALDAEGKTPLHLACVLHLAELLPVLLSYNATIDFQDYKGKAPLHYCKEAELIRYLCDEGANVNVCDIDGVTPLHTYVQEENIAAVKMILQYGANPMKDEVILQRNSLHVASSLGNYELLVSILQGSQLPLKFDSPDNEGFTPLQLAASGDRATGEQPKIIMLLLDKGASVGMGNERGVTALHLVCANRMLSSLSLTEPILDMLLDVGADPNAQDIDGCTPLVISIANREWNTARLLLEAGGDLNIPCSMKSSFLQLGKALLSGDDAFDKKSIELINAADCTASDLLPKGPRYTLFASIRVLQTRIPGETRDRCMNCAATFSTAVSSFSSYFKLSSGKHHCRHCHRVVCQECSPHEVARAKLPGFVQEAYAESNLRTCLVCYAVLIEKRL